jgi:hypothetical protein
MTRIRVFCLRTDTKLRIQNGWERRILVCISGGDRTGNSESKFVSIWQFEILVCEQTRNREFKNGRERRILVCISGGHETGNSEIKFISVWQLEILVCEQTRNREFKNGRESSNFGFYFRWRQNWNFDSYKENWLGFTLTNKWIHCERKQSEMRLTVCFWNFGALLVWVVYLPPLGFLRGIVTSSLIPKFQKHAALVASVIKQTTR